MSRGIFNVLANEDITDEIVTGATNDSNIKKEELEALIGIKISELNEAHRKEEQVENNKRLKDTALVLEDLAIIARTAEGNNEPLNKDLIEVVARMAVAGTDTDPSLLLPQGATSDYILNKSKHISSLAVS